MNAAEAPVKFYRERTTLKPYFVYQIDNRDFPGLDNLLYIIEYEPRNA